MDFVIQKALEIHHKPARERLHFYGGGGWNESGGQKRRSRKNLFPVNTQSAVEPGLTGQLSDWAAVNSLTLGSSFHQWLQLLTLVVPKRPTLVFSAPGGAAWGYVEPLKT